MDAVGGTLIVYGTPDEEITCTKVQLTDEGAFDELDVALMLHPYQKTCGRMGSIGIYPVQYEFFGKKCHANEAGPGSDCINALDAAVAAYLSVNQVKQYLDANIYGILNSGGTLPNIIPDYASLRYYIRCDQEWKTRRAVERINRCVQGAADSMGAELKITQYLCPTQPLLLNEPLLDAYEANMAALGEPGRGGGGQPPIYRRGQRELPDTHPPRDARHSRMWGCRSAYRGVRRPNRDRGGPGGHPAGVCALAGVGYDLLTRPELLEAVRADFQRGIREQDEKGVSSSCY